MAAPRYPTTSTSAVDKGAHRNGGEEIRTPIASILGAVLGLYDPLTPLSGVGVGVATKGTYCLLHDLDGCGGAGRTVVCPLD